MRLAGTKKLRRAPLLGDEADRVLGDIPPERRLDQAWLVAPDGRRWRGPEAIWRPQVPPVRRKDEENVRPLGMHRLRVQSRVVELSLPQYIDGGYLPPIFGDIHGRDKYRGGRTNRYPYGRSRTPGAR